MWLELCSDYGVKKHLIIYKYNHDYLLIVFKITNYQLCTNPPWDYKLII